MLLYADEHFPFPVVKILRQLGHDVVTTQQDGQRAAPDSQILARAHVLARAVLTHNRRDCMRLDRQGIMQSGIVLVTNDKDFAALATRINAALMGRLPGRWSIRVNRPP